MNSSSLKGWTVCSRWRANAPISHQSKARQTAAQQYTVCTLPAIHSYYMIRTPLPSNRVEISKRCQIFGVFKKYVVANRPPPCGHHLNCPQPSPFSQMPCECTTVKDCKSTAHPTRAEFCRADQVSVYRDFLCALRRPQVPNPRHALQPTAALNREAFR